MSDRATRLRLPHRWVVEHSFAWPARFRRLAREYERVPETLIVASTSFSAHAPVVSSTAASEPGTAPSSPRLAQVGLAP